MPRSIAAICGVPFRRIVKHKTVKRMEIEVLSCGHQQLCKSQDSVCCAAQRRCYACKREGYESPRNRKIRLMHEHHDRATEPFTEEAERERNKK